MKGMDCKKWLTLHMEKVRLIFALASLLVHSSLLASKVQGLSMSQLAVPERKESRKAKV